MLAPSRPAYSPPILLSPGENLTNDGLGLRCAEDSQEQRALFGLEYQLKAQKAAAISLESNEFRELRDERIVARWKNELKTLFQFAHTRNAFE